MKTENSFQEVDSESFTGEWVRYSLRNTTQGTIDTQIHVNIDDINSIVGKCLVDDFFCDRYIQNFGENYIKINGDYIISIYSQNYFASENTLSGEISVSLSNSSGGLPQAFGSTFWQYTRDNIIPKSPLGISHASAEYNDAIKSALVPTQNLSGSLLSSARINGGTGAMALIDTKLQTFISGIELNLSELGNISNNNSSALFVRFPDDEKIILDTIVAIPENESDSYLLVDTKNGLECSSANNCSMILSPENLKKYPIIRISYR